jgi:hypothetical protein
LGGVEQFHCNPALFGVVGRLWLNYLQWWRSEGWGIDEYRMNVTKLGTGSMRFRDERKYEKQSQNKSGAAGGAATTTASGTPNGPNGHGGDDELGDVEQTETDDESRANPLLDPTAHEPVDAKAAAEQNDMNGGMPSTRRRQHSGSSISMDTSNDMDDARMALAIANGIDLYGDGADDMPSSQPQQLPVPSLPSSNSNTTTTVNSNRTINEASPLESAVDFPRYIPPRAPRHKSGLWSERVTVHRPGDLAISLSLYALFVYPSTLFPSSRRVLITFVMDMLD